MSKVPSSAGQLLENFTQEIIPHSPTFNFSPLELLEYALWSYGGIEYEDQLGFWKWNSWVYADSLNRAERRA